MVMAALEKVVEMNLLMSKYMDGADSSVMVNLAVHCKKNNPDSELYSQIVLLFRIIHI